MLNEGKTQANKIPVDIADERDRVRVAVEAAVEAADGDLPKASKILEQQAKSDPALFQMIAGPFLPHACWQLMRQQAYRERQAIWTTPHWDPLQNGGRVSHLANENFRNLMEFHLPILGLPKLGDALKDQVHEAASFYFSQAKTEMQRGKWLEAVAALLKGKKPVSAQLEPEDLERCFNDVQANV